MAELVSAFLVPHAPLMFSSPDAAPAEQKHTVIGAFEQIAERIRALRATTAIIIGSDHYILFGPACLPSMLIGIGDVDGPLERIPGLVRGVIDNNTALARVLFEQGRRSGFDWAVAKALTIDHAIAIPYQMCVKPNAGMKIVPIYLNSGVDPAITMARARALGEFIGDTVREWRSDERVVVIGSGGISHWVGSAQMGTVNARFDRHILDLVEAGDLDALAELDDAYLEAEAGNGAREIRNHVCAMAAVAPCRGRTVAYEPVPEWVTGLGFAEVTRVAQNSVRTAHGA
ncbi:MAG: protocatechuate 3,4-dioxygenase [Proteobacteria bacterium]|nr:protocatechuate 3,4-dioxygenase [Pseudomonadota bacterium]